MTTEATEATPDESTVETPQEPVTTEVAHEPTATTEEPTDDAETFPREYVERLRKENGDNRVKAKKSDDYAARLHNLLVKETGRLADPTDLPFDEEHLTNPSTVNAAIDELLATKPHLASRKPTGDIGQGLVSEASGTVNLAGLLRSNAR